MIETETSRGGGEPVPVGGAAVSRPVARENSSRTLRWVLWSVLILVMGGLSANFVRQQWRSMQRRDITPMERFNTVPAFSFTSQTGQPFGSEQTRGKIWLANFFFTTCPGPCLQMNHKVMEIQEALNGDHSDVQMVSFSVNPEQDTVDVLKRYAERMKARPGHWFFLTGERSKIYDIAKQGFMLLTMQAPGEEGKPSAEVQFIHSTKVALVDRQGVVRRYYASEGPEVVQQVLSDVGSLLREQPAAAAPKR